MKLIVRLVTVVCYFFPFTFFLTTCNNTLELRFSYNQTEADKNILLEKESSELAIADTAQYQRPISVETARQTILTDTVKTSSDTLQKSSGDGDKLLGKIVMPTDTSLSGIGSVLYFKNLTGQIAITISLLISLTLFVAFRFLTSQKGKFYLLLISTVCITIFIIDSFISNVTLLCGSWTLLILLLLQLFQEFRIRRKPTISFTNLLSRRDK